MSYSVECVVVGAGVIGLAIARQLALAGREVVVLEAADAIGSGVSSRNSEVIHAGIYYPFESLKARLCVRGREQLYAFCESNGVPFRRLGKLIVATTPAQLSALEELHRKGLANGVRDLTVLDQRRVQELEPALRAYAALFSPSTGIVDIHALMLAYQGAAEAMGAITVCSAPVMGAEADRNGFMVEVGGAEPMVLRSRIMINAASLGAIPLARRIRGLSPESVPQAYLCKGSYYSLSGRAPFSHLVYPVPEHTAGLGVHLTLDLAGGARFGPDVEWVSEENYDVDPTRARGFYDAIRTYWPALPDNSLHPAYAGIRPKITEPSAAAADFVISGPEEHGLPGLVNLFGIESPGLTASLAIAEYVSALPGIADC